jgi:hypothetical protein
MKKRDERVKSLKSNLEQKQEEELMQELTLSPRLVTSSKLRNKEAARTTEELYDHLYSWHGFYTRKSAKRREQEESNFRSATSFIPLVNENSKKLAERRASSRSRSQSRSRSRLNSFDASSINTESVMVSSRTSRDFNNYHSDIQQRNKVTTPTSTVVYDAPFSPKEEIHFFGTSNLTVPPINQDIIEKLQSITMNEMNVPVKDESYWKVVTSQHVSPVVDSPSSPVAAPVDVNALKVDNKWQLSLDDLSLPLRGADDDDQENVFHRLYNTVWSFFRFCFFVLYYYRLDKKEMNCDRLYRVSMTEASDIPLILE